MLGLKRLLKIELGAPPIFAHLVLDDGVRQRFINVEEEQWQIRKAGYVKRAKRAGLVLHGHRKPAFMVTLNGNKPEYFSRVIGSIGQAGHKTVRVACLQVGKTYVWLHENGFVEIGPEPSLKEDENG